MKAIFSFVLLMFLPGIILPQKIVIPKNRIPVQHPDFHAWVEVYDGEVKFSALENNKTYFWLKAKQVHASKGGYEGNLLHGTYTALYKTDALKEKGHYNKGLKTGTWKEWHTNGELKCVSKWKNGLPKGWFVYYNMYGKVVQREQHKHGLLHGKQILYTDSTETILKYKRGKKLLPKTKRKKTKIKPVKAEEIKTSTDTMYQQKNKKWFRLNRQNKKTSEQVKEQEKTKPRKNKP